MNRFPCHRTLLFVLFVFLCCRAVMAGDMCNEMMNSITKENGLAGESVSCIMTNHTGQVWVGTSDGLNRYNGKRLMTFPVPRAGRKHNYTFDLCEGSDHTIYAATGEGVFAWSPGSRALRRIAPAVGRAETILHDGRNLYMGNRDGLYVFDGKTVVGPLKVGRSPLGLENSVRDIVRGAGGRIWFLSRYALNSYDPQTGKVSSRRLTAGLPDGTAFGRLLLVGGRFFIGTKNNGLYVYHPTTRQMTAVGGVGNVVTGLAATAGGDVCVSTDGSGAFLLDGRNLTVKKRFDTRAGTHYRLPTNAVYCYHRDSNGVDWFGFHRFGLAYIYHSSPLFRTYSLGAFSTEGLDVRSFCRRGRELMIGTGQGLYHVDEAGGRVRSLSTDQLGGLHIITNIAFFNGLYYVASYDGGLRSVDPETMAVRRLAQNRLLGNTTVTSLVVSPDNRLWIGTGEGLFILDCNGHLDRYTENNTQIPGGVVGSLFFDSRGNAWIGGAQGLTFYSAFNRQFESSHFPAGFFNKEEKLTGVAGHAGLIFFYTPTSVYFTDLQMKRFGSLRLPAELLDETCYSFLDDLQGHYWLATENGLFRMDYNMKNLQHFGFGEGLRSRIVSNGSLRVEADGRVWFGTANGLLSVDSHALEHWQRNARYKVLLYDIRKDGEQVSIVDEDDINEHRRMRLAWNITSVSLSVKPVLEDFARPYGRLYQYRVDGERAWRMARDGEEIRLGGLSLGSHRFEVRLTGAPGTAKVYDIMVMPSWVALFELLLLLAAIGLFVWWRAYHKATNRLLAERNEIEDALVEVEQRQQQALLETEQQELLERERERGVLSAESSKYERVKLNEAECTDLVERMRAYVETSKVYTDPNLKMSDVADYLHLSPSRLSQVFNLYLKENYYDFINRYRLEEFKRLIAAGEYRRYTLTALSEKCGFRKSSFFSTFRKVEKMTPTEYLKTLNVKL